MKIIKEGRIVEEVKIYTGTCKRCGCVVECEEKELKHKFETYGIGAMERDEAIEYVVCPTSNCFSHITTSRKIFR